MTIYITAPAGTGPNPLGQNRKSIREKRRAALKRPLRSEHTYGTV